MRSPLQNYPVREWIVLIVLWRLNKIWAKEIKADLNIGFIQAAVISLALLEFYIQILLIFLNLIRLGKDISIHRYSFSNLFFCQRKIVQLIRSVGKKLNLQWWFRNFMPAPWNKAALLTLQVGDPQDSHRGITFFFTPTPSLGWLHAGLFTH